MSADDWTSIDLSHLPALSDGDSIVLETRVLIIDPCPCELPECSRWRRLLAMYLDPGPFGPETG